MKQRQWRPKNHIELLENGEEFFPSVFKAIELAEQEILIETFIWFDDEIGRQLRTLLIEAAQRGVRVDITVDGYGSAQLDHEFVQGLTASGVRLHVYGPLPPVLGYQTNMFRRMHRKLVVIDGAAAWVGGINYSLQHLRKYGEKSKQDYAVKVQGNVVEDIHTFCLETLDSRHGGDSMKPRRRSLRNWIRGVTQSWALPDGDARAMFLCRDNQDQRTSIEAMYRMGLRSAKSDVIIMNAYFYPGYRFLRAMRAAVKRGVRVRLILQGNPDKDYVKFAGLTMYDYLLKIGVEIWEYLERPSHAKVAVMGDQWATVGSSNLDPFSLSLNLEANLVIHDRDFTNKLRRNLDGILAQHCKRITREDVAKHGPIRHLWRFLSYHLLRWFPRIARLIPVKLDRLYTLEASNAAGVPNAAGRDWR